MTIVDVLQARCDRHTDRTSIVSSDGAILTYGELSKRVQASATQLINMSLAPGSIVGTLGRQPFDFPVAYLAALASGHVLFDCGIDRGHWSAGHADGTWSPLMGTSLEDADYAGSVIIPTSGTTGRPRLCVLSQQGLMWATWNGLSIGAELGGSPLEPPANVASALQSKEPDDFTFVTGMPAGTIAFLTTLNRCLLTGERFVVSRSLSAVDLAEDARRFSATTMAVPPFTGLRLLRIQPERLPSSLVQIGLGGSNAAPGLLEELEVRLDVPVVSAYGTTEVGGPALMTRPWDPPAIRWTTIGRTIGAVQSRLAHKEDGSTTLELYSPSAMVGTLDVSRGVVNPHTGWIQTGDIVRVQDGQGNLTVIGRTDHVIARGARVIDPTRVEFLVDRGPGVMRSGVVGVPSRVAGEQDLAAFVILDVGATTSEVKRYCLHSCEPGLNPRHVIAVSELPLARDGAIDRMGMTLLAQRVGLA